MTNKEIDLLFRGFDVENATMSQLIGERDYVKQTIAFINRSLEDLKMYSFNGCYDRVGDEAKKALDSLIANLETTRYVYAKQALRFDIELNQRFGIFLDDPEVVKELENEKVPDDSILKTNTKQNN